MFDFFQWSNQVTVGDVLTLVGLVGGFVGLIFVVVQIRAGARQLQQATIQAVATTEQAKATTEQARISAEQAQKTATAQRGRFVLDVINRYLDDQEMFLLHSVIDPNSLAYDTDTHLGPQDAAAFSRAISRTFYYFDTVKFLVDRNLILLEDVAILKYRIITFFESSQVSEFLHGRDPRLSHGLARELYVQLNTPSSSL